MIPIAAYATDSYRVSRPHSVLTSLLGALVLLPTACGLEGGSGSPEAELLENVRSSAEYRGTPPPRSVSCTESEAARRASNGQHEAVYDCDVEYEDGARSHLCYAPSG